MELDEPSFAFTPAVDRRPILPEPPPVRLVAVEDVTLRASRRSAAAPAWLKVAPAASAAALLAFYVGLLRFEPDPKEPGLVFRAENARLRLVLTDEPPDPNELRFLGIEVPSLAALEAQLVDRKIEYLKERSIDLGQTVLLLQDPAGNWLRIAGNP